MRLDGTEIIKRSVKLMGFNGDSANTVGEISLLVYAEWVNLNTCFLVLDYPSAYNVIFGCLWIHKMKVVPSSYHQVVQFPTKWKAKSIRGEQKASSSCYGNSMKQKATQEKELQQLQKVDGREASTKWKTWMRSPLILLIRREKSKLGRPIKANLMRRLE